MSKPIDIDKLAREATAELKKRATPLTPKDVPIEPMFWSVIVEPVPPKETVGSMGIVVAKQSQDVEKIQTTIGYVLKIGSLAFKAKTASGIDLSTENIRLKTGDCVLFARYTGQQIKLPQKEGDDRMVIMLSDTDILGVVTDPEKIRFWI